MHTDTQQPGARRFPSSIDAFKPVRGDIDDDLAWNAGSRELQVERRSRDGPGPAAMAITVQGVRLRPPPSIGTALQAVGEWIGSKWRAYRQAQDDRRAEAALRALSDRHLKDIGVHRSEIGSMVHVSERDGSRRRRGIVRRRPASV